MDGHEAAVLVKGAKGAAAGADGAVRAAAPIDLGDMVRPGIDRFQAQAHAGDKDVRVGGAAVAVADPFLAGVVPMPGAGPGVHQAHAVQGDEVRPGLGHGQAAPLTPVSYTHLRAHETVLDLV